MCFPKIHKEVFCEVVMEDKNKPQVDDKEQVIEETEVAPIDEKIETIHFPWFIAIVIGVLMVAIIGLIIAIKIIEG